MIFQYINEHAPAQIRGFLTVSYTLWVFLIGRLSSEKTDDG